jgi:hypothetical protein
VNTPDNDASGREAAVRRTVGIAALRKLRRMADADTAEAQARARRARVLLAAIVIITALALGFLLRDVIFGK